ncbi:uncharacterized protein CDV56_107472 [Aspergillus thermomutatus]|uniref:F-box domain-containing protein n=1 Tax=Aspergillus thermomutatus TaxID=41047 RepID=A0A397HEV1_ASPTH|nr:uncharacterized protein CDV56_107472 [Aspergillus thermomutatus]RHZ59813.1 hypothetical protein CDV56_107472 [Aspergillus thermomutatus]
MGLLDLPVEIVLLIAELLSQRDLNALQQTNQRSHSLLYSTLLRHNIRVHNSSALLWAAKANDLQLAERLFREGAMVSSLEEPKVPTRKFGHPLYFAAENGHEEMVKLLLQHGANPTTEKTSCGPAIYVAAKQGYVGISEIILSAISTSSEAAKHMVLGMWIAIFFCDLPVIEGMIERCARFYSPEAEEEFGPRNDHSLLSKIIECGCSESTIRAFVQVGAKDILDEEWSALGRAVLRGDPRIVELLLTNGYDPTNQGALGYAAGQGAMHMIQLFLKHGCRMRRMGRLPFLRAIRKGRYDVVELLLQEGADPSGSSVFLEDLEDNVVLEHLSAISCAIHYRQPAILKLLIENGERPERMDIALAEVMKDPEALALLAQFRHNNGPL